MVVATDVLFDRLLRAPAIDSIHVCIPILCVFRCKTDVDTNRPDEKSVITYVASYYHTFARMKNEMKSGRRIANVNIFDGFGSRADLNDEFFRVYSPLDTRPTDGHGQEKNSLRATDVGPAGMDTRENQGAGKPQFSELPRRHPA